MSLRLILLRHGETVWNRERRYQGWQDVALSAEGRRQAEAAARTLLAEAPAAVYTSPLGRARETAEIIAAPRRLPVTADEAFKEMSFGEWEGLTVDEVSDRFPELRRAWRAEPHTVQFPRGESLSSTAARVGAGIDRLREGYEGQTVVLVSHGIVTRLIVLDALGLGPDRLWTLYADPAGITEIEYGSRSTTVHRMNTLLHLWGAHAP